MDAALKIKVAEVFSKYKFSKEDADFLSQVLEGIDTRQERDFQQGMDQLLHQKDKTELIERIESNKTDLIDRIESNKSELDRKLQETKTELIERIQDTETDLCKEIQEVKTELIDRIQNVKTSLTAQIYIVGLIQFLAIVGSILAIMNFMLK